MPFVYTPRYRVDIGPHVFPMEKYGMVADRLHRQGVPSTAFHEPTPASDGVLTLVHTPDYLDDLTGLRWTPRTKQSELPLTDEIIGMFVLAAGGTILAARLALDRGYAAHIGGGFHHAFADKAEGFCYINDLAVAARVLIEEGAIERAAVIDCDLHQGNGTAAIFRSDPSVFTFSIHQRDLYPPKEESDRDIHLPNGVRDEEYLAHVSGEIPRILDGHRPQLVLYQAGADPYGGDTLGDLCLSKAGLRGRDWVVLHACRHRGIPVVVTLGGGYAFRTEDTVDIHVGTCDLAWQLFEAP